MTLIDKYELEFSKCLRPHFTESQTKERTQELRTHLELDAAERIEKGESQADAERAACRTAGAPKVVARQMIRQARGYDSTPAWRLTWPLGIAMFFAFVIPYSLLGYLPWYDSIGVAVRWAPFCVLVLFGIRVVQTKRWLITPMAAWAALVSVGIIAGSLLVVPPQPTEAQKTASSKALQGALVQVEGEQKTVDAWLSGHPPVAQAPVSENGAVMSSSIYPFIPIPITHSEPLVSLEAAPNPIVAQQRWKEFGQAYQSDVHQRLLNLKQSMSHEPVSRPDTKGIAWNCFTLWWQATLFQVFILAIVNAGLLALIRLQQSRQNRRDPLLA